MLAARRHAYVASATFLTTMLDFTDPGEIGVYITREGLAAREPVLMTGQRVHGSELANAFASLRANELVWNYVVNNYLKGRTPPAFDLLYWNGDSSNLPGPMYVYYLREMYLDNRLREPNALTMAGARIDLSKIRMPVYVYASRDDHIVPWRSAFRTTALVGGETTFVLGASGHIAGVVNPPAPLKRNYWVNTANRRGRGRVARRRGERAGKLVAPLVSLARTARRCAPSCARSRGRCRPSAADGRAGQLRPGRRALTSARRAPTLGAGTLPSRRLRAVQLATPEDTSFGTDGGVPSGSVNVEPRAAAGDVRGPDRPAVRLDDAAADREARGRRPASPIRARRA